MAIVKTNITVDAEALEKEWHDLQLIRHSPINLTRPQHLTDQQGLNYGAETLYDYAQMRYVIQQEEYNQPMDFIRGRYIGRVINNVRALVPFSIGRVRLIQLRPKECLTYHTDKESKIRYHIPIITNDNVMFIVEDVVYRMNERGAMYTLDVTKKHTVLNASREHRVHLVLDAY